MACADKRHSFQTARAAAEAGMLDSFVTGLYYRRGRWPYSPIDSLGRALRSSNLRRLHGYRDEVLDNQCVRTIPWLRFAYHALTRAPGIRSTELVPLIGEFADETFDRIVADRYLQPCDIFHGFGRFSLTTIERAKRLGAITILDQPEIHPDVMRALEVEESRYAGIPIAEVSWVEQRSLTRRRRELGSADFVFVGLDYVRRTLVQEGIASERIRVIPYGADVEQSPHPIDRSERHGPFTILHVGALNWFKGLHYLLDALVRLKLANAKLIVVGRGHSAWNAYLQSRMASMPGVELISGLPHDELMRCYEQADLFVFPSLVGGLGLVVYEAMSTGLPVIVSDGDVIIRDGQDGLVAHPKQTGALEAAILRLYEDADLRRHLGQNGRLRARQFSCQAYRRRIGEVYQEILQHSLEQERTPTSTGRGPHEVS
jgi:alpha-maltose-1-phosphate synthase